MAPIIKQAWTPSVEVHWHGELPDSFRAEVDAILGRSLSDEAWHRLNRVTFAYSFFLNREYVAATLADQKKAVKQLLGATEELLSAIEAADAPEMGLVVTNRLAEKWDDLYDRSAEYDRHVQGMSDDIAYILKFNGHGAPEEQAQQCIDDWTGRGMLVRPSMPTDFVNLLGQFRDAVRLFSSGLAKGNELYDELGDGWIEFVGQLTDWGDEFGLKLWASKSELFGGSAGTITYLAKAINEQIPEMREPDGSRSVKQMRRPAISDASLAASIFKARAKYQARRPQGDA